MARGGIVDATNSAPRGQPWAITALMAGIMEAPATTNQSATCTHESTRKTWSCRFVAIDDEGLSPLGSDPQGFMRGVPQAKISQPTMTPHSAITAGTHT